VTASGFTLENRSQLGRALRGLRTDLVEIETSGISEAVAPIVEEARGNAQGGGIQARRAAPGIRIVEGSPPRVEWSGAGRVVSGGGTISQLSGGVEFGGPSYFPSGGRRFPTPHSPAGRFLLPTMTSRADTVPRAISGIVVDAWNKAARRSR
jgi:hypothetical protein